MMGDMKSQPWAALINATLQRHTWRATLPRRHVVLIRSGIIEGAGVIDRPFKGIMLLFFLDLQRRVAPTRPSPYYLLYEPFARGRRDGF